MGTNLLFIVLVPAVPSPPLCTYVHTLAHIVHVFGSVFYKIFTSSCFLSGDRV